MGLAGHSSDSAVNRRPAQRERVQSIDLARKAPNRKFPSPPIQALIVSELRGGRTVVQVAKVYQVCTATVLEVWLRHELGTRQRAA